MNTKGALIATAVAGLFATTVAPAIVRAQTQQPPVLVRCQGANACKGQSGCKSANNSCAGKNGCKGQGFVRMTEQECRDQGGTVLPPDKKDDKKDDAGH
jgi:hypothetical protein